MLYVACQEGRSAHVAVLLTPEYLGKARPAFQVASKYDRTPIMVAVHAQCRPMSRVYVQCVKLLIPHAARVMSLDDAAALYGRLFQQDSQKAVKMLLNHVAGLEDHVTRSATSTMLHQAVEAGHLGMVELAINRGGKQGLETPNAVGQTPLGGAAAQKRGRGQLCAGAGCGRRV